MGVLTSARRKFPVHLHDGARVVRRHAAWPLLVLLCLVPVAPLRAQSADRAVPQPAVAVEPDTRESDTHDYDTNGLVGPVAARYREHITAALREYRAHRFFEARSLFAQAHAESPSARTLRGLAMVEFELRNYVDSAALFERALAEPVRPLTGLLRQQTEQLWRRAQGFVAHYEIVSKQALTISVDNVRSEQEAVEGSTMLSLPVGDHVLELSALGYVTQRKLVRVQGGEHELLSVQLEPLEPGRRSRDKPSRLLVREEPQAHVLERDPYHSQPLYKNKWLWTSVGVVVTAAAIGLGFGLTKNDGATADPISARPVAIRSGP